MRKWSIDELVLALYAYCHVPFNKASNIHPWILYISKLIDRSPAAIKMKIGNFGAFDPELQVRGIVGLSNYSALDKSVWDKYFGNWEALFDDAEVIISRKERAVEESGAKIAFPQGKDVSVVTTHRTGQSFFRECVLGSYNSQCCVTGISNPLLIEACHIKSWVDNRPLRTDPSNGLCLNSLLHKAYDNYLMSISPDLNVYFTDKFIDCCADVNFKQYFCLKQGTPIILPTKFFPKRQYLAEHYEKTLANR